MANGILDAFSKHAVFSETLDALNKDPLTAHQMKGFDFAQRFPSFVPGGVYTPTSFVGPALAKGYQYGQELSRALLDGMGGFTIGDAIKKAGIESDANIEGMQGKGFNMDTYNQNLQDFNIDDVTFAKNFGIPTLKNKFANIGKTISDAVISPAYAPELDDIESIIEARKNREELNRIGSLALDDAGLNTAAMVDEFSQTSKPRFDLRNFLTNVKDKGIDMLGSGKDIALRGIGSIIGGLPGSLIGSLIGNIKESPTDKVGLASFGGDYDPYGFKGQLTSGTLGTRQDPFGRNIVSAFGDYYGNRLAEVAKLSKLQNLNKFQKAKLDFGKKYLEKVKEERAKKEAAQRAAVDRMFQQGQGGSGQDFTGGRFDRARSRAEYDRDPTGFSGSS